MSSQRGPLLSKITCNRNKNKKLKIVLHQRLKAVYGRKSPVWLLGFIGPLWPSFPSPPLSFFSCFFPCPSFILLFHLLLLHSLLLLFLLLSPSPSLSFKLQSLEQSLAVSSQDQADWEAGILCNWTWTSTRLRNSPGRVFLLALSKDKQGEQWSPLHFGVNNTLSRLWLVVPIRAIALGQV